MNKALSTLSQKSETVAENGEKMATVALFCDSLTFLRLCGQGLTFIIIIIIVNNIIITIIIIIITVTVR